MNTAIELALESIEHSGGPFGAVIVKNNQIIGRGSNQVTCVNDPTAHAEIQAIRDACHTIQSFSLAGCSLYSSSEPCPMCLSAIYWARLDQVYYANTYQDASRIGFDDQFIFKELSLPDAQKKITLQRVTAQDVLDNALKVFQTWDKSPFKLSY